MAGPQVNNNASTIDVGKVSGQVSVAGPGKPGGPGMLHVTVSSAWGEPLRTTLVNVPAANLSGPWSYSFASVPAYNGLIVGVSYSGPWSLVTGGGAVGGQTGSFTLAPNGASTQNLQLKATLLH
jgi:hypothetical protein